jgi:hypothetical protein
MDDGGRSSTIGTLSGRTGRPLAALAVLGLVASSCGGDRRPASPTSPAGTPLAGARGSGGSGGSDEAPLTAAARPRPCRLGLGDPHATCGTGGSPQLLPLVETAIDRLIQQRPMLFDFNDVSAPDTTLYKVLDSEAYFDGIVLNLMAQGACAQRDPGDPYYEKILVKTSRDRSEKYDVLTSSGYIRRGGGSFIDSCSPASFPLQRASDVPPASSGCGQPYPPPVTRFSCTVHLRSPEYDTLDSTPLVGPDVAYCAAIGYTDGRSFCPVRLDGAPDRYACEIWRVGNADDTGYPGPTWTKVDAGYCTGPSSGCQVAPGNPFKLWVYAGGPYKAEADNGASCTVTSGR